jgi:hypothetical protein
MNIDILNGVTRLDSLAYGDEQLGFIGKKARARRKARQDARLDRKRLRAEGKRVKDEARAQAIAGGYGAGQKIAKESGALTESLAKIGGGIAQLKTGGAFPNPFMPDVPSAPTKEGEGEQTFFTKYKTPILIGGGSLALLGVVMAMKKKKKPTRKRRK